MKSITVDVNRPFRITIGNAREDSALQVNFDFSGWMADYGTGSISLLVKRNGDSDPYPVLLDTEGTIATWDISNVDTDKVGVGEAQLIYTTDSVLKKSTVFTFDVVRALDSGTTPPDPYVSLIEQMTDLATAAQDAADDAEDYAEDAQGYASDAEGYKNDASGYATQASGYASDASGYANEAKGYRNDASGYATQASGYASDAQGYKNDASGYASSASGYASDAQGYASDAQGYKNDASGYASQASGYASNASGYADAASGYADAASDSADDAQEYANSIGENLAPVYDEDESYAVGDYCFYDGGLYVCNTETTGEWDEDDWNAISVTQALNDVVSFSVPPAVRQAIYILLNKAAYTTTGLDDDIAIVRSWAGEVMSLTLSASTLSLSGTTPQKLTATTVPSSAAVTWLSSDTSTAIVYTDGTVKGVDNGSCTVTAYAGNLTAECAVTVSGIAYVTSISAAYTQSGTVYDDDLLDSLKADLVVTATYSDSTTRTVPSADYTLSGTLTSGTSTVTVSYKGCTATFTVTVTHLVIDTTAEVTLQDGKYYYRDSSSYSLKTSSNAGVTKKYEVTGAPLSNTLLCGIIPTDALSNKTLLVDDKSAVLIYYDANAAATSSYWQELSATDGFYRWAQDVSGTMTECRINANTIANPYSYLTFAVDKRYLSQAYMYEGRTRQVFFAGEDTPFYGLTSISPVSITATYNQPRKVTTATTWDTICESLTIEAVLTNGNTVDVDSRGCTFTPSTLSVGTNLVTVQYGNATDTITIVVSESLVPSTYQEVEYLYANQYSKTNGAYIKTDAKFDNPTTAVYEYGVLPDSAMSNATTWNETACFVANRQTNTGDTNNQGFVSGMNSTKTQMHSWSYISAGWSPSDTSVFYQYHDVVATWTATQMAIKIDNDETIYGATGTARGCSGYYIGLFGNPSNKSSPVGASYLAKARLYYVRIKQDGELIFNGIPCIRNSDSKVGIYNTVTGVFSAASVAGSGTGASASRITAGPII